MHDGIGKELVLVIYLIKYLNEPLLIYKCILDNTILLFFTLSILIDF